MLAQDFFFEVSLVIFNNGEEEFAFHLDFVFAHGPQIIGKGGGAAVHQLSAEPESAAHELSVRHRTALYPQKEGMFFETAEVSDMVRSQLGQGFNAKIGFNPFEAPVPGDRLTIYLGDCIQKDKTSQFAAEDYSFHFFTTRAAF